MAWVSSLLSLALGVAHAGEPVPYWEPGLANLGRNAIVYADLNGDGFMDMAADTGGPGEASAIVVLDGASLDYATYSLPDSVPVLGLDTGEFDGDGVPELLITMPTYDTDVGLVAVMHAVADPGQTVAATDYTALAVTGSTPGELMGTAALLHDIDGDGLAELYVSAPGSNKGSGAVYAFDHKVGGSVTSREAVGSWVHKTTALGLGAGLAIVDALGMPTLVMATCDGFDPTLPGCTTGGDLITDPATNWTLDTVLSVDPEYTLLSSAPNAFFAADIASPDVVAHVTDSGLQTFQIGVETTLVQSIVFGSSGGSASLVDDLTDDGAPDWLIQHGESVYVVSDLATSGALEDLAIETYQLVGTTLGAAVFGTGDLDKDDCADALASAPEEGAIYLLPGTCAVTDTGDTGDTGGAQDTADTGDTAPTETDTDTDPIDTADTADTADTGECQEEFGWACTSAGTTPGWWVCLLPLAVVRRRRPAQRRP